ncbi:hypothetical protein JB92DRAFT_3073967 [Gautieria morchelliformis]|nr:hypothetical protein JB92DRAFT_3073967 [Gautieria morchelliformis]
MHRKSALSLRRTCTICRRLHIPMHRPQPHPDTMHSAAWSTHGAQNYAAELSPLQRPNPHGEAHVFPVAQPFPTTVRHATRGLINVSPGAR